MIALRADGVDAGRSGIPILHGVDLVVEQGRVHALLGPNGAGKSTLLAVLAGDLQPQRGTVTLRTAAGQLVSPQELSAKELARRRCVVPQQTTVAFAFTCREIVRMGRAPWARVKGLDDEGIVDQALRTAGVEALADRHFATLSGGERALVALARALAQSTPILLLDEPTAALDLHHTELVLQIARRRAIAGDAVVVVLHDLSLAAAHADTVTLMNRGRVVTSGPPAQALAAGTLTEVYGHPVEVLEHPRTGIPMVLPIRDHTPAPR